MEGTSYYKRRVRVTKKGGYELTKKWYEDKKKKLAMAEIEGSPGAKKLSGLNHLQYWTCGVGHNSQLERVTGLWF